MWKTVLVAQPSGWAVLAGKLVVAMLASASCWAVRSRPPSSSAPSGWLPADRLRRRVARPVGLYALQWAFASALVAFAFLMVYVARNVALGHDPGVLPAGPARGLYTVYAAVVGFQPINRFNVFLQTIRLRQVLEDLPTYFFTANVYAPARRRPATWWRRSVPRRRRESGGQDFDLGGLLGTGITLEHASWVVAGYTACCWRCSPGGSCAPTSSELPGTGRGRGPRCGPRVHLGPCRRRRPPRPA
jgi:hypothetical protein